MRKNSRLFNGMQALQAARHKYAPIDYDELLDITKIWVDAALRLRKKDLKMMHKLVKAQNIKSIELTHKLRTRQDRRFDNELISFPFTDSYSNVVLYDRRKISDKRNAA